MIHKLISKNRITPSAIYSPPLRYLIFFLLISIASTTRSHAQSTNAAPYRFIPDNGYQYDYGMRRNVYPDCFTSEDFAMGPDMASPCRAPGDDRLPFNSGSIEYYSYIFRQNAAADMLVFRKLIRVGNDADWFGLDQRIYPKIISAEFDDRHHFGEEGVCLRVWAINPINKRIGNLVYGLVKLSDFEITSWTETYEDGLPQAVYQGTYPDFDLKDVSDIRKNLTWAMFSWGQLGELGSHNSYPPLHTENLELAIEVYAVGASEIKFTIPGLGEFDVDKINASTIPISIKVNDITQNPSGNIDIQLGDKVDFVLTSLTEINTSSILINNLPGVWVARSAGETKYYCTPSITPGEFKPWIGFDSQVHGSYLAKYPPGYNPREADWIHTVADNGIHHYTLTWYAQRQMDPAKISYAPSIHWQDTKTVSSAIAYPGGSTLVQRNSQRDGLNMELLRAWREYENGNGPRYLLGTDPDEFVYLGLQDPIPLAQNVLKGQYEGWKLPQRVGPSSEGEDDDPIIELVKSYKSFQEQQAGININRDYNGYEIEDYGTFCKKILDPTGSKKIADPLTPCDGGDCMYNANGWPGLENSGSNNAAPGIVTLSASGIGEINFQLQVTSPLNANSFYGVIEGTQWPARYEQHVPYTLKGLDNKSPEELSRYILCLEHVNSIGQRTVQSHHLEDELDLSSDEGHASINGLGQWTTYFDMADGGYYNVTAYIKTYDGKDSVMIGGKELRAIDLRFVSVAGSVNQGNYPDGKTPEGLDLKEGRGDGKYWYTVGFNRTSPFHIPYYGVPDDQYQKRYVFSVHDKVTFMTFDADPHTFENYKTEFYISKRLQAKGIPDDTLNTEQYLSWWKYPITSSGFGDAEIIQAKNPTRIGQGRNCTHQWDDIGLYELRTTYRTDTMKVMYTINVVQYNYDNAKPNWTNATKGNITISPLTPDEIQWLGLPPNTPYKIARVDNILSRYKYVDGPRELPDRVDGKDLVNRYEKFNDFNAQYEWKLITDDGTTINYTQPGIVSDWLAKEKAHVYATWFPWNWMRHTADNYKAPSDIGTQYSTNISDFSDVLATIFRTSKEDWQIRLPWIAKAQFSGYLTRTNIKVIYDLDAFFDPTYGAFTGKGNHKYSNYKTYRSDVANPIDPSKFTDTEKERYLFYVSLLHNNAIIYDPSEVDGLQVFNSGITVNSEGTNTSVINFIAGKSMNEFSSEFLKGADLSSAYNLAQTNGAGSATSDAGYAYVKTSSALTRVTADRNDDGYYDYSPFQVLHNYGANVVRLHLWQNPTSNYFTTAQTIELIHKAHEQGLKVIVDLMLSDTWTNPAAQIIPQAWRTDYFTWVESMAIGGNYVGSMTALKNDVYQYAYNVLQQMNAANALPEYVQVGNETSSRILMPKKFTDYNASSVSDLEDIARYLDKQPGEITDLSQLYTINWDWNATLVNEALRAVRQFTLSDGSRIQTIFHMPFYYSMHWWVDQAINKNAPGRIGTTVVDEFDFIGASFYLANTGGQSPSIAGLREEIRKVGEDFGKKVLVLETGFPRTWDDADTQGNVWSPENEQGPGNWGAGIDAQHAPTDADQRRWLIDLRDNLRQEPNAAGFLLWEPLWKGGEPGIWESGSAWDNMGFLDTDGKLVPNGGVQVFCENCNDADKDMAFASARQNVCQINGTNFDIYPLQNGIRFAKDFVISGYSQNVPAYLTAPVDENYFQFLQVFSNSESEIYFVATENMFNNIILNNSTIRNNITAFTGNMKQTLPAPQLVISSLFTASKKHATYTTTYTYNLYKIPANGIDHFFLDAYDRRSLTADEEVRAIEGPFLVTGAAPDIRLFSFSVMNKLLHRSAYSSEYLLASQGGDQTSYPTHSQEAIQQALTGGADMVQIDVRKTSDDYLLAYPLIYPIGGTDFGTENIPVLSAADVSSAMSGMPSMPELQKINLNIFPRAIEPIESLNYIGVDGLEHAALRNRQGERVMDATGHPIKIKYIHEILSWVYHNNKVLVINNAIDYGTAFNAYYGAMITHTRDKIVFTGHSSPEEITQRYGESFMKQIVYIPIFEPEDWRVDHDEKAWPWVSYLAFKDAEEHKDWRIPAIVLNYKNDVPGRASNQFDYIKNDIGNTKWVGSNQWSPTGCTTYNYTTLSEKCDHAEAGCLNYDKRGDPNFLIKKGINLFITDDFRSMQHFLSALTEQ